MHDSLLDKDQRWLVLDPECRSRNKTSCTVRQISLGSEENEKQKKSLVKDVRMLSSEQPNEPRAIGNLIARSEVGIDDALRGHSVCNANRRPKI